MRLMIIAAIAGSIAAFPGTGDAQQVRLAVLGGHSVPVPSDHRGEMTSGGVIGSAKDGGPFISVGLEHGQGVAVRVEAVYSRHSSAPDEMNVESDGITVRSNYAAEKEQTAGALVSVLVPVAQLGAMPVRLAFSGGGLRTQLEGKGIVGGDGITRVNNTSTAPAIGFGIESSLPIGERFEGLVGLRAAQLILTEERGGGHLALGLGLRW